MPVRFRVSAFDEVSSTNELVKEAIARGEGEGFAVTARVQTGGYGRRGNPWASPAGSLYISFLLEPGKPDAEVPTLSMIAALAVCETLGKFVAPREATRIKVKWPNDVVVMRDGDSSRRFSKICGISTEKVGGKVCLGIGVNVKHPTDDEGEHDGGGKNRAIYLDDIVVDTALPSVDDVRETLLQELGRLYDKWVEQPFGTFVPLLNERSALIDRHIQVASPALAKKGGTLRGMAQGIADDGALVVRAEGSGTMVHFHEGTITLI